MPFKNEEDRKKWSRKYYLENRDFKCKQSTEYYYKNHEKRKLQKKLWAERNKEKLKLYRKVYAPRYKERKRKEERARYKLHDAIKSGKIKRIDLCSSCGKKGLIHAHHEDYNKPLEVIWLCHQCHFSRHRRKNDRDSK